MDTEQNTVLVCEVGPRDGLQNEETILAPRRKVELIDQLSSCGCERIEAASFVNPDRVPQMAHAEQVMNDITRRRGTSYSGLVLNLRGAKRALDSGVDRINFAFAVTETFNQRNQGRRIAESLQDFERMAELARDAGIQCTATLGASFGCPFEGEVPVKTVGQLAHRVTVAGADEVVISDTIGVGVPTQVTALVRAVRAAAGDVRLGCLFITLATPGSPMPSRRSLLGSRSSMPRWAVLEDARSPPKPRATYPQRTSSMCSMAWVTRPRYAFRSSCPWRTGWRRRSDTRCLEW